MRKTSNKDVSIHTDLQWKVFNAAYLQSGFKPEQIAAWLATLPGGKEVLMAQALKIAMGERR